MDLHRSQWTRGLRRGSATALLLRSWVQIPPGAWKFVCCECRVLSVRGLCDELITRPEESYLLWCVVVCDLETSRMRRPWPTGGCYAERRKNILLLLLLLTAIELSLGGSSPYTSYMCYFWKILFSSFCIYLKSRRVVHGRRSLTVYLLHSIMSPLQKN